MVWYRVRTAIRSWAIFILVLIMHGTLIYLLLVTLAKNHKSLTTGERVIESKPVYFMPNASTPAPAQLTPQSQNPPPPKEDPDVASRTPDPIAKHEPTPEPEKKLDREMLFASLYQKSSAPEEADTDDATDQTAPDMEPPSSDKQADMGPEESPIVDPLTLVKEVEKKEKMLTPDSIAPKNVAKPPAGVATDDIPMDFEGGVHTTQLSARDSLFHTFIKAVNTALYKSITEGIPPFTPGIQPVAIRMVIVRTGRLAQRPTMVRSSGNPMRDHWYIDAIVRASAAFPPIPEALRLPFAEMIFKEGSKAIRP